MNITCPAVAMTALAILYYSDPRYLLVIPAGLPLLGFLRHRYRDNNLRTGIVAAVSFLLRCFGMISWPAEAQTPTGPSVLHARVGFFVENQRTYFRQSLGSPLYEYRINGGRFNLDPITGREYEVLDFTCSPVTFKEECILPGTTPPVSCSAISNHQFVVVSSFTSTRRLPGGSVEETARKGAVCLGFRYQNYAVIARHAYKAGMTSIRTDNSTNYEFLIPSDAVVKHTEVPNYLMTANDLVFVHIPENIWSTLGVKSVRCKTFCSLSQGPINVKGVNEIGSYTKSDGALVGSDTPDIHARGLASHRASTIAGYSTSLVWCKEDGMWKIRGIHIGGNPKVGHNYLITSTAFLQICKELKICIPLPGKLEDLIAESREPRPTFRMWSNAQWEAWEALRDQRIEDAAWEEQGAYEEMERYARLDEERDDDRESPEEAEEQRRAIEQINDQVYWEEESRNSARATRPRVRAASRPRRVANRQTRIMQRAAVYDRSGEIPHAVSARNCEPRHRVSDGNPQGPDQYDMTTEDDAESAGGDFELDPLDESRPGSPSVAESITQSDLETWYEEDWTIPVEGWFTTAEYITISLTLFATYSVAMAKYFNTQGTYGYELALSALGRAIMFCTPTNDSYVIRDHPILIKLVDELRGTLEHHGESVTEVLQFMRDMTVAQTDMKERWESDVWAEGRRRWENGHVRSDMDRRRRVETEARASAQVTREEGNQSWDIRPQPVDGRIDLRDLIRRRGHADLQHGDVMELLRAEALPSQVKKLWFENHGTSFVREEDMMPESIIRPSFVCHASVVVAIGLVYKVARRMISRSTRRRAPVFRATTPTPPEDDESSDAGSDESDDFAEDGTDWPETEVQFERVVDEVEAVEPPTSTVLAIYQPTFVQVLPNREAILAPVDLVRLIDERLDEALTPEARTLFRTLGRTHYDDLEDLGGHAADPWSEEEDEESAWQFRPRPMRSVWGEMGEDREIRAELQDASRYDVSLFDAIGRTDAQQLADVALGYPAADTDVETYAEFLLNQAAEERDRRWDESPFRDDGTLLGPGERGRSDHQTSLFGLGDEPTTPTWHPFSGAGHKLIEEETLVAESIQTVAEEIIGLQNAMDVLDTLIEEVPEPLELSRFSASDTPADDMLAEIVQTSPATLAPPPGLPEPRTWDSALASLDIQVPPRTFGVCESIEPPSDLSRLATTVIQLTEQIENLKRDQVESLKMLDEENRRRAAADEEAKTQEAEKHQKRGRRSRRRNWMVKESISVEPEKDEDPPPAVDLLVQYPLFMSRLERSTPAEPPPIPYVESKDNDFVPESIDLGALMERELEDSEDDEVEVVEPNGEDYVPESIQKLVREKIEELKNRIEIPDYLFEVSRRQPRTYKRHTKDTPPSKTVKRDRVEATEADVRDLVRSMLAGDYSLLYKSCFTKESVMATSYGQLMKKALDEASFNRFTGSMAVVPNFDKEDFATRCGAYRYEKRGKGETEPTFPLDCAATRAAVAAGVDMDKCFPPRSAAGIVSSLTQQAATVRSPPKISPFDLPTADTVWANMVREYPVPDKDLGLTGTPGFDVILDSFEAKCSGWTARVHNLDKAALAKKERSWLILLATIRIILRKCCEDEMPTMGPVDMVVNGLCDPKQAETKGGEPYPREKYLKEHWRIIWVASALDTLVQGLLHHAQNKADIAGYQDGEFYLSMAGLGHNPPGFQRLGEVLRAIADPETGKIFSQDASRWDLTVSRELIILDGERRIALSVKKREQRLAKLALGAAVVPDDAITAECYLGLYECIRLEAFVNSAHTLAFHGEIYEVNHFGITASGIKSTTAQNCFARTFAVQVCGGGPSGSLGDDNVCRYKPDVGSQEALGLIPKLKGSGYFTLTDNGAGVPVGVPMTSHDVKYCDVQERFYGDFLNFDKMIGKLVLCYKGEDPGANALGGCLYCLRESGPDIRRVYDIATAAGWDFDRAYERIGIPVHFDEC